MPLYGRTSLSFLIKEGKKSRGNKLPEKRELKNKFSCTRPSTFLKKHKLKAIIKEILKLIKKDKLRKKIKRNRFDKEGNFKGKSKEERKNIKEPEIKRLNKLGKYVLIRK